MSRRTRRRSLRCHIAGESHRRARHAPAHYRPLRFEPLEDRRLLSITVNTLLDENDGIGAGEGTSLREAIAAATTGTTINFDPALTSGGPETIVLTHGQLSITQGLTISGPGANLLTIDANGTDRVFNVDVAGTVATVQISGLKITDGFTAADGGGIFNQENLIVTGCWITGNTADDGGGIGNFGDGTFSVIDSTISGNMSTGLSGGGGGIFNFGNLKSQISTISNSTISGNVAATRGGGVNNFIGTINIQFSTITANTAPIGAGSGVTSWNDRNVARTAIKSSIISGNTSTDVDIFPKSFPPTQPSFYSLGDNLIGNGDAAQFFVNNDATTITNPLLGPLQDNGGPTPTHMPQRGSLAIDTGNAAGAPTFDQRGTPFGRVFDGDGNGSAIIDKGAVESDAVYVVVDTLEDENDGVGAGLGTSLRDAIAAAASITVGTPTIVFASSILSGMNPTIALNHHDLTINHSVVIQGPGASKLTIDAQQNSRVFDITNGAASLLDVKISGLTLKNGIDSLRGGAIQNQEKLKFSDGVISGSKATYGGGIYNWPGAELTLLRSTITGNHAQGPSGTVAAGGGIYNWGGFVDIQDSTITGNQADSLGGGVSNGYTGYISISNSTLSNNTTGGSGGGLADTAGFINISSSTISGNQATQGGGGVFLQTPNNFVITISNSTISGNIAPIGGGVFNFSSQTIIEFSTITNNGTPGGTGGGIAAISTYSFGSTSVGSSIIVGNKGADVDFVSGDGNNTIQSENYNLVGTGNAVSSFDQEDDSQITLAALALGPLADNGGPTMSHALLFGSPAIDGGNPDASAGLLGVPKYDQRGAQMRRVHGVIDVGAFEAQATPPVLPGNYTDAGSSNHIVDAADYTVWRDNLGGTVAVPYAGADGNGDKVIDAGDFAVWKANFGHTSPGSGGGGSALTAQVESPASESLEAAATTPQSPATVATNFNVILGFDHARQITATAAPAILRAAPNSVSARTADAALLAWLTSGENPATSNDDAIDLAAHASSASDSANNGAAEAVDHALVALGVGELS